MVELTPEGMEEAGRDEDDGGDRMDRMASLMDEMTFASILLDTIKEEMRWETK